MPIHVFGHKNPDTDAIVSAIALSYWLNQQDMPAIPCRLGDLNQETKYLLNFAKVRTPTLLTTLPAQTAIALVDHNESQQSIANLGDYAIRYVIDHHKFGDLTTPEPTYIRLQPVGSTSSILYQMFQQPSCTGIRWLISQKIATLMLGAIISDTLNLTGPTTTEHDRQAVADLSHMAGIRDVDGFANALFEAKSEISHLSAIELVTADYKQFQFADKVWGIACIETVRPQTVLARIDELQPAIQTIKQRNALDFLLVIVVDILQQQSWAIATHDAQDGIVAQSFNTQLTQLTHQTHQTHQTLVPKVTAQTLPLGNRVSRKKQLVPTLEAYYQAQR